MKMPVRLGLGALFLALLVLGALRSYAWFTDQAALRVGAFTTGTLDIVLEPAEPPWRWGQYPGSPHPPGQENPARRPPEGLVPGATITFLLRVRSTGTLPLDYTVAAEVQGDLGTGPTPCTVTAVRIDGVETWADALSEAGGPDDADYLEIDVTMPWEAGSEYQGKGGELVVTVDAIQQGAR